MADDTSALVAEPSPNEMRDPEMRRELKRAAVWLGLAATMALVVILIQPILIILAGMVFASMLDSGVRLLGRALPIARDTLQRSGEGGLAQRLAALQRRPVGM